MARQLGKPSGWFSPIMARLLNRGNARQNEDCIDALKLESTFTVLDIGFGGGVSFPRLLRECSDGRVVGTEISGEMLARARSVWSRELAAGRLEVHQCGAEQMGFPDDTFDRVMSVNTLYFWPDLEAGLAEVRRVLVPGGRFVASVVPGELLGKLGFAEVGFRIEPPAHYASALERSGLVDVRLDSTGDGKGAVLVSGVEPPAA